MSYFNIDTAIIIGYIVLTLYIGFRSGRGVQNLRQYAVGNKDFATFSLMATIVATKISGSGAFIDTSEMFSNGIIFILIILGQVLGLLIVGHIVGSRMKPYMNSLTICEVFGNIYGKRAQAIASISALMVCIGLVSAQIKVMANLISYVSSYDVYTTTVISAMIIVLYSSFGGIRAVTFTDVIQFMAIAVAIPLVGNIGVDYLQGYEKLINQAPSSHFKIFSHNKISHYFVIFLFLLFPALNPAHAQRLLMAKNTAQIKSSHNMAALMFLPYTLFMAIIGLVALASAPDVAPSKAFLYVIDQYMPIGIKGVVLVGVIAMVMSTADSNMNVGGVTIVNDFYKVMFKNTTSRGELLLSRIVTFVVGSFAVPLSLHFQSLLDLVVFIQSFWGPVIGVPLLLGIFGFRSSERVALSAMAVGATVVIVWNFYNLDSIVGFGSFVPALLANLITLLTLDYLFSGPNSPQGGSNNPPDEPATSTSSSLSYTTNAHNQTRQTQAANTNIYSFSS